jgi:hypothetical protein
VAREEKERQSRQRSREETRGWGGEREEERKVKDIAIFMVEFLRCSKLL